VGAPASHSTPLHAQVAPAASSARPLARNALRSHRFTTTGWSGVTGSIIPRCGEKGSVSSPSPSAPALPIAQAS
jgi:hypothetical protein